MTRKYGPPPSLDTIEVIARNALAKLPEPFAGHLRDVVLIVEDFPSEELLADLEMDDPFELTGLYSGRPAETEVYTGDLPPMIHLFRRPILDEWASGEVTLEDLVAHVLIHEAGHHFGLSDDDMEWLEDELKKGATVS
ncbi:metallopeptidase family protein [Asticcacaulis sp. YBE204]|uniref:metallopeptidase family protein n=1 Tax=Asticcacaulis sp. YBE204 TaxID=1282363 RepID=UPI0003C3AF95|nr:metallopeptidase family protein [Asticcacaulis sp. YBE204]ESQ77829.1 Neutral zinc metallopeptidase [Asticcacaulis sp. YBE204]